MTLIKFIGGWFAFYLFIAFVGWIANIETMSYAQCLNAEPVWWISITLGWICGAYWTCLEEE